MILKVYVEEGERLVDAIARVAILAGQNGFKGYEIHCRECDELIGPEPPCYCMRKREMSFTPRQEERL